MIKNVIFDLGGVLIDWNPKEVFKTIFDSNSEVDWFLENVCTMDWNVRQDAGRSLEEATRTLQIKHPKWHDQIAAYYGRWEEMLIGPISDTVDILDQLKKNNQVNLFALTNWSAETFPVALERYDFLQWFQGIVVSGNEKCIKPNAKIYEVILDRYNLNAAECLFIDDNKLNVRGALAQGMQSIWFESSSKLRSDLKSLDLL